MCQSYKNVILNTLIVKIKRGETNEFLRETQQEEQNEEIKNAQYLISNKAYKFDSQTAKLEIIDLSTNQKEEI